MITSINPLGMNFFVLVSRIANTTSNAAMTMSANPRASAAPEQPRDRRQDQCRRRNRRGDQRHLAAGLQEPDQAADQQQNNINPEHGVLAHSLCRGYSSCNGF